MAGGQNPETRFQTTLAQRGRDYIQEKGHFIIEICVPGPGLCWDAAIPFNDGARDLWQAIGLDAVGSTEEKAESLQQLYNEAARMRDCLVCWKKPSQPMANMDSRFEWFLNVRFQKIFKVMSPEK